MGEKLTNVGERLQEVFRHLAPDKTIRSIAASIDVSFSHLSKILRDDEPLSKEILTRMALYFLLPPEKLEDFLEGKIQLNKLESAAYSEKFALIDFSKSTPPAWRMVLNSGIEKATEDGFRKVWLNNILVFFALARINQNEKSYYEFLSSTKADYEPFCEWVEQIENPLHRRLVFHAFLFSLQPVEYALRRGLLHLDRALTDFKEPDKYISTPAFAFDLINKEGK